MCLSNFNFVPINLNFIIQFFIKEIIIIKLYAFFLYIESRFLRAFEGSQKAFDGFLRAFDGFLRAFERFSKALERFS